MGIKGLTSLINDEAPNAISEHEIKTFFGRKVAIDASMSLYQFLIAVRQQDGQQLMSESGETTSHLMGFFYRTLRMIEHGIKPMYVFDGKPPDLKKQVLAGRFEKRADAKEEEEAEKDTADAERMNQLSRRQVRVTKQHNEEVRELLRLMGIPCVVAPSEAEAQCAELVRAGKVYAVGSEDMDTLTFGATKMLKHLTFSEQKKMPVHEVDLQKVLAGFEMSMDQFIDLCILLGCDYLEKINGIGPKTALKLIREHETLDAVIEHLRIQAEEKANASPKKPKASKATAASDKKGKGKAKVEDSDEDSDKEEDDEHEKPKVETPAPKRRGGIQIPELWPYKEAKELFKHPDVQKGDDLELKWISPDVEGLVAFLCTDKGFNEDRVRKGAEKLKKALTQKQQGRLDGFFTVTPAAKRKPEDDKKSAKDKKSKTASGSGAKGGKGKGKK